jgi:hypothetical protein
MCDVKEKIDVDIGYGTTIGVHACSVRLVELLNNNGFPVISADCGQEVAPTQIGLRDGRTMIIVPRDIGKIILKLLSWIPNKFIDKIRKKL